ncbi:MAG: helix-turn-helix domain-containing protein [Pseudomonadota bacterium]|nr:helix-turn-helix domain-containing protein [Pseudomonadota bacterium]
MTTTFGDILREWRGLRRFSQLALSLEAEMSARHLSFLESGRASPSRAMVLRLAEALQMPRAIANHALQAAGFAPAYPQLGAGAVDLAPIRTAIDVTLSNHEPFPAVAIDQHWDILAANSAALTLFAAIGLAGQSNMIEALTAAGDGEAIENWEETALLALQRTRAEMIALGGDARLKTLADRLAAHPRLADGDLSSINLNQAVIPTRIRVDGSSLAMFSTIAQFGSVQDVSASEIRIEMMFPLDDATRRHFIAAGN